MRLKETFSTVTRSKDVLAEENRQLKQLLSLHGITWNGTGGVDELAFNTSPGYTSSGSISGSYAPGSSYSPPPQTYSSTPNTQYQSSASPFGSNDRSVAQQQVQPGIDYDQAGIDFVLTYANPPKAYQSPPQQ